MNQPDRPRAAPHVQDALRRFDAEREAAAANLRKPNVGSLKGEEPIDGQTLTSGSLWKRIWKNTIG